MELVQSYWEMLSGYMQDESFIPILAIGTFILLFFYLLPSFVALGRRKRQALAIFLLNLFAGWTFLGWLIALVWAAMVDRPEASRRSERPMPEQAGVRDFQYDDIRPNYAATSTAPERAERNPFRPVRPKKPLRSQEILDYQPSKIEKLYLALSRKKDF